MKYKTENFYFIIGQQLAVQALQHPIVVVTQIGKHYTAVGQIGDFHLAARQQVGRADFTVGRFEVGVALVLYLHQLVPMGEAQIAGDGIECSGMRGSLILGKAQQPLQRSGTDAHTRSALNVERQKCAVRG